jgi:hypothetical protein
VREPPGPAARVRAMSTEVHRSRWSRPLVGLASVAVIGAGMGAFFGIRAVAGAGSSPASAGQPPARTGAAMAYDPANGSVVLFGGESRFHTLDDTWIWDGSGWTQAHPATSPPPLENVQMAYDPVSHDVLLVGGQQLATPDSGSVACSGGSGSSSSGSTGSTGISVPPNEPIPAIAPAPSESANARQGTAAAASGCDAVVSPDAATWLWNGSDWSKAAVSTPFVVFGSGAIATDPVSGRVVLLPRGPFAEPALGEAEPAIACPMQSPADPGAQPNCSGPIFADPAWTWNGHEWNVMAPNLSASSYELFRSSIVDDAVTGKLATFGGNVAQPVPVPFPCSGCVGNNALQPSAADNGTESIWTGTAWKIVTTYTGGPEMPGTAFVGDTATHSDVALADGQTWIWTGVWTRAHPATAPPVVSGAASAYDETTGQIVIFGGSGTSSNTAGLYDQTWTWDGSNWTRRGGSAGPSVVIPVPSPVSVPPGLPCHPVPEPDQPAGTATAQPATICNNSTGGATGIASGGGAATS